ncbi:COP9 signalosome complex subunit 3 [Dendrobium catenatum]|uniref:COP9 signalosome complex subunit 3 n=1 Tax=Dendrobium catenatum TaxID=906689 RepID=A0A2I0WJ46_9ASPA|nr:COP9 signalosome complex subunit 3 [Dendrobium catenatum]PKU75684.1 COP9 signalosome complex subunit 3 [Dendrobium catenatum]
MDSVEVLVAHIQDLSGNPVELAHLHAILKQSEDTLRVQASRLVPFIEQLDPSSHSLGYLFLLEAYSSGPILRENISSFLACVVGFINFCSAEQIRLAPDKFISVCKRFKDQVIQHQVPIQGVAPLRTAVRKLQSSYEQLTALHSDFLFLCLLSKCYKAGTSVLDDEVLEIDQPRDFFLFCYYGGMINIGLKRFPKALECLHNVVTAPMSTINAIAIEAYKKYILVALIHLGQIPSLPKYTASTVLRSLKSYAQLYVGLASSYATGKFSELEAFIQTNVEKFQTDNNLGLVKQVLSSLYKRNIQRLTQTYLTLSLQDIANAVHLNTSKEAEMRVLQMIQDGDIFATINQKDGMVSFHEDPEQYKTCEMIDQIDSSIQRLMALSNKLTAIDEHISCDPAYITKIGRERPRLDFDDFDSVPHKFL